MTFDFKHKRVVVAGGSHGIGRAIAIGFAAAGADVSVCARGSEALERTRDVLAQHGGKAHARVCDLADAAAVAACVQEAAQALGVKERIPFGRLGTPEEIAEVALFLASPHARWITGQTIVVDGGQLLSS